MAFNDDNFDRVVRHVGTIFNQYVYKSDDSSAEAMQPGYFASSNFNSEEGWEGSEIKASLSDGFFTFKIGSDGASVSNIDEAYSKSSYFDGIKQSSATVTVGVGFPSSDYYSITLNDNYRYFDIKGLPEAQQEFPTVLGGTFLRGRGPVVDGAGDRPLSDNAWSVKLSFYGSIATVRVSGTTNESYGFVIDGESAIANATANSRIEIDTGTTGYHEITVMLRLGQSIEGFYVNDGYPYVVTNQDSKVLLIGDSFTANTISPTSTPINPNTGVGSIFQQVLGANVITHGIGGSGYVAGNALTNQYRINDAISVGADLVVIAIGINDIGESEAAVKSAVQTVIDGLAGQNLLIVGPWAGSLNQDAQLLNLESWIGEVCTSNGVRFVPINNIANPWVWGDGDTNTATTVTGSNSQFITGDDGTHPSPLSGDFYLAKKLAEVIL